jgi:hypothetical protein
MGNKVKNMLLFLQRLRIKLLNWEYWPTALVYGPIFPVYLWYCLRARSFFFTAASNPTIQHAGLMMESKFSIDSVVPSEYRPASLLIEPGTAMSSILALLAKNNFSYPIVVKPDIGGKGMGVSKVENDEQLTAIVSTYPVPFLVQPFIQFPLEIGLFWVKIPGKQEGMITGIVRKEFLQVTGDGRQSVRSLLQSNDRYLLQLPSLEKLLGTGMNKVIPAGTTELLVPYGNHARGALFIDESRLITPLLTASFNNICNRINGFYFGRLDIRYKSWTELEKGEQFSIIELNGAGSEPTHIYDPKHSLFFAWKEIIRHWKLLWIVSRENKKRNTGQWMSFGDGIDMIRSYFRYMKKCRQGF